MNLKDLLIGLFIGTFIFGPIIWTAKGREEAVKAISRAMKVSEAALMRAVESGGKK